MVGFELVRIAVSQKWRFPGVGGWRWDRGMQSKLKMDFNGKGHRRDSALVVCDGKCNKGK